MSRRDELLEDGVVVRADVLHGVIERDVQHRLAVQQIVERHVDDERGLPDAVPGEHQAEMSPTEAPVESLLEQAERRSGIQEAADHGLLHAHSSSILRRSAYFSSNSLVVSDGHGR
ncbi:MAG: hypothetical protein M5U32_20235 [Myxococcota bacterium]|nr:hypothetical protein [Myxococcota bacterium]